MKKNTIIDKGYINDSKNNLNRNYKSLYIKYKNKYNNLKQISKKTGGSIQKIPGEMNDLINSYLECDGLINKITANPNELKSINWQKLNQVQITNYPGSSFQNTICNGNQDCYDYLNKCLYHKLEKEYPDDDNNINKIALKSIEKGNVKDTEYCIERFGFPINYVDSEGQNLAHIAIIHQNLDFLKKLELSSLNHLDQQNNSPLMKACLRYYFLDEFKKKQMLDCIDYLFKKSVILSHRGTSNIFINNDIEGKFIPIALQPIFQSLNFFEYCVYLNNNEIIQLFEKNNKNNIDKRVIKFYYDENAQFIAVLGNNSFILNKILEYQKINQKEFMYSIVTNKSYIFKIYIDRILKKSFNTNDRLKLLNLDDSVLQDIIYLTREKNSIIHYLVLLSSKEYLKKILKINGVKHSFNENYELPIHFAIKYDNFEIFQIISYNLINRRDNINNIGQLIKFVEKIYENHLTRTQRDSINEEISVDIEGFGNLLNYAIYKRSTKIIKFLIKSGTKDFLTRRAKSFYIKSSLFLAVDQGDIELINQLVNNNCVNIHQGLKIIDEDEEPIIDEEVPHMKYGIYSYSILIQASEEIQNTILNLLLKNLRGNQSRGTLQILLNQRPLDIIYLRTRYNREVRNLVKVTGEERRIATERIATERIATEGIEATAIESQEVTAIESQEVTAIESQEATAIESQEATSIESQKGTSIESQEATAIESQEATAIESQDPDCPICLDAVGPTDDITRMNCAHSDRFHYNCINEHYQTSNTCPLCRQQSFINNLVINVANPFIREIFRFI